jgi:hypothetical protein
MGVLDISHFQGILMRPPLTLPVLLDLFLYVLEGKKCILFEKSCIGFEEQVASA